MTLGTRRLGAAPSVIQGHPQERMNDMWNLLRAIHRSFSPEAAGKFWRNREYIVHAKGLRRYLIPWYRHANQKILNRHNATIPCTSAVHPFTTPHGLAGIFISYGASIGQGCTIFHQVTIGSNTLPDSRGQGAPTIGNYVYIGAGAKIIGDVTVGDYARIGANCVVVSDVPANATVVLDAPKVIVHDTPRDNTFIPWKHYRSTAPAVSQN